MYGAPQGDPRVKRMLEVLDLKYSVDGDGDFKVVVKFDDGRSQLAYINSETQSINDFEIRELWSIAYVSKGYLDIDTANTLLMKNHEMKIGSWRLVDAGDNTYLVTFCIQIAANCDPKSFTQSLSLVLRVADKMEAALTGADIL
jgi:hypothetical protein